jgi:hypothetical protein
MKRSYCLFATQNYACGYLKLRSISLYQLDLLLGAFAFANIERVQLLHLSINLFVLVGLSVAIQLQNGQYTIRFHIDGNDKYVIDVFM